MNDEVNDIKRLLVEFNDGKRAYLTADDEHEWIVTCVPRNQTGEVWTKGAMEEIRNYIHTWIAWYGVFHSTNPKVLRDLLLREHESLCAWINGSADTIANVEKYGSEVEQENASN